MKRLVVIGTGFVGATIAYTTMIKNLVDEIVLIDIDEEHARGEALDMSHGIAEFGSGKIRVGDYMDCADCEMIVVTAGINRKVGQTRDDLLEQNQKIMELVMNKVQKFYDNSFVLIVSNPVDQLTTFVHSLGFIPENKLCGTGCMLDTSRWIKRLSEYLSVDIGSVEAYAVGKHGSCQDLLWNEVKINAVGIDEYCEKHAIPWNEKIREELHSEITDMGANIIARKGKTQFGIAVVVAYCIASLKSETYTKVSLGNMLDKEQCLSDVVYLGNWEVKKMCECREQ